MIRLKNRHLAGFN